MEVTHLGLSLSGTLTNKDDLEFLQGNDSVSPDSGPRSSPSDAYKPYRFSSMNNSPNMEEILNYFQGNSKEKINQTIEDLKGELKSREETDRLIMIKLFSLDEQDQEKELRRLLQELDRTDELERILFGESELKGKNPSINESLQLGFDLDAFFHKIQQRENSSTEAGEVEVELSQAMESDPLVLDLSGNGIKTTGLDHGITFDIDGDMKPEETSFVSDDDYLLAIDKNQNLKIDSGKELFGQANGFKDGIFELQSYDQNQDGVINTEDPIFEELILINDSSALKLIDAGIAEISLERKQIKGFFKNGDRYEGGLEFKLSDGQKRQALDVYFQIRDLTK